LLNHHPYLEKPIGLETAIITAKQVFAKETLFCFFRLDTVIPKMLNVSVLSIGFIPFKPDPVWFRRHTIILFIVMEPVKKKAGSLYLGGNDCLP